MKEVNSGLPDKNQVISRQHAFTKASAHALRALDVVIEIMENKRMNPNARLGAARTIIDKVLPDLKSTQFVDDEGNTVKFNINMFIQKVYGINLERTNSSPQLPSDSKE